ncbi:hypothetical protein P5V15_001153 [Pogonomyrmex californicus]
MASEKTSQEFDYLAYIRDLLKITYPTEATLYLDGISVVETVQVRNLIKIQIRHPNGYLCIYDIKINGFMNINHRRWIRYQRRQHKEYLYFLWKEITREDVFDLQRLFGLRPYEEDEEVW